MLTATGRQAACPQCGAAVEASEEGDVLLCASCGSSLVREGAHALRHEMLEPVLRRDELQARLGRWLTEREVLGSPTHVRARLVSFPLWVLPDASGTRVIPAAPLLVEPAGGFAVPAGDRKAFREDRTGDITVLPASIPVGSDEPPPGTRLVHVPFWAVSYQHGTRSCEAWLDAVTGRVLPLSSPPSGERRLDASYSLVLVLTWLVLLAGFLALFAGGGRSILGLAVLALAGPAAHAVVRRTIARLERP